MGKLVTFWSPVAGQAKVTASMVAVVSSLAMGQPSYEIAVSSVRKEESSLEDSLEGRNRWRRSEYLYERSGISALLLSCKQGALTRERIRRCALPVLLPGVSLFPGLRKEIGMIHGRESEKLEYHILTESFREEYGLTVVDLKDGFLDSSFQYMEAADLVVVVLPQNPTIWKCFLECGRERLKEKKIYILFGGYLKNSRHGIAQYKRKHIVNRESGIGAVPLCEGYMDALSEGKAMEFFMKNEYAGKRDENYEFVDTVKKAAKGISNAVFLS